MARRSAAVPLACCPDQNRDQAWSL